eukprot:12538410-Alexandrium_andersonii.AAC.1
MRSCFGQFQLGLGSSVTEFRLILDALEGCALRRLSLGYRLCWQTSPAGATEALLQGGLGGQSLVG